MVFRVVLKKAIVGQAEFNTTTLNIVDGMLIKGKYRTPINNIQYIEELQ